MPILLLNYQLPNEFSSIDEATYSVGSQVYNTSYLVETFLELWSTAILPLFLQQSS